MPYEEKRVVETDDPIADPVVERDVVAEPDPVVAPDTVVERRQVVQPDTVVERPPTTRYVQTDDPVGNAFAASSLISTIVWSIVVLVLLVVLLLALHTYAHLF